MDIIFIADLFINFRTTLKFSLSDDEITDSKEIAMYYLRNRFFIDLVASIPFDALLTHTDGGGVDYKFRIFSILKMIRLLRFTRVIIYLNATDSVKHSLKLFKLIFYLVVYIHWQACAWFFYTKSDQTWFPLIDLISGRVELYTNPLSYQYCFSVWHSVMILDGADMVPATDDQAIVVSILVILAEFVRANILGTIGVVITAINLKSTKFAEQIEFATSTMKTMKIATPLKNKILEYLTSK